MSSNRAASSTSSKYAAAGSSSVTTIHTNTSRSLDFSASDVFSQLEEKDYTSQSQQMSLVSSLDSYSVGGSTDGIGFYESKDMAIKSSSSDSWREDNGVGPRSDGGGNGTSRGYASSVVASAPSTGSSGASVGSVNPFESDE